MGNRAVIVFDDASFEATGLGVYLHWNGGVESVQAFLDVTRERCGGVDLVGFVQTVANFFQYDGSTVYVGRVENLDTDNGDNGTFYVNREGKIVRREHEQPHMRFSPRESADYMNKVRAHVRAAQSPKRDQGEDWRMEQELDEVLQRGLKAFAARGEGARHG